MVEDLQAQFANLKQLQVSRVKWISTIKDETIEATTQLQNSIENN